MKAPFPVLGLCALLLALGAFAVAHGVLRSRSVATRVVVLAAAAISSLPALWFGLYYLHILPEHEWLYEARSWRGSEFFVVFLGIAAGALASLLPRRLLAFPLFGVTAFAVVPHVKPLLGPLPDEVFQDRWKGEVCLQSSPSTCGPASVATILRRLGFAASEQEIARAAFSYTGGTEAWHLARHIRGRGLAARFVFRPSFSLDVGQPALVGVRIGGAGHFIAVLEARDEAVAFADPLHGPGLLPLAEFQKRYEFTGFHMVVSKR